MTKNLFNLLRNAKNLNQRRKIIAKHLENCVLKEILPEESSLLNDKKIPDKRQINPSPYNYVVGYEHLRDDPPSGKKYSVYVLSGVRIKEDTKLLVVDYDEEIFIIQIEHMERPETSPDYL